MQCSTLSECESMATTLRLATLPHFYPAVAVSYPAYALRW